MILFAEPFVKDVARFQTLIPKRVKMLVCICMSKGVCCPPKTPLKSKQPNFHGAEKAAVTFSLLCRLEDAVIKPTTSHQSFPGCVWSAFIHHGALLQIVRRTFLSSGGTSLGKNLSPWMVQNVYSFSFSFSIQPSTLPLLLLGRERKSGKLYRILASFIRAAWLIAGCFRTFEVRYLSCQKLLYHCRFGKYSLQEKSAPVSSDLNSLALRDCRSNVPETRKIFVQMSRSDSWGTFCAAW